MSEIRTASRRAEAKDRLREYGLFFGVWGIALVASLFNLLNFHDYPLFTPEVGLALIGIVLVALSMGGLQLLAQPRLSFLLTGLFAAIVVGMNAPLEPVHVYAIWAIVSGLAFFFDKVVLKLAGAAFASVALFQGLALASGGTGLPPQAKARTVLPNVGASTRAPIVHIVLDSSLGLEGMRYDPARFGGLHAAQLSFYARHGFQAYDGAYSRHVKTLNSLPFAFSYGRAPLATTSQNKQYATPGKLAYFADLETRGYVVRGLMPDFIDLCAHQDFAGCELFKRSALASMVDSGMDAESKAKTFAFTMLTLSRITVTAAEFAQGVARDVFGVESRRMYNRTKLFPLASGNALRRFTADLSTIDHGEVRYVHLLLPHDPYVFKSDCSVKPEPEWLHEHGPGSLEARDLAYADQALCTLKRLDGVMTALAASAAGRDAIVVIHGDHGSRVVDDLPLDGAPGSRRTEMMAYSTQFAIRVPGEAGAVMPGRFALDELLADFAKRDFSAAPRPAVQSSWVLPMDEEWIPRKPQKLRPYVGDLTDY